MTRQNITVTALDHTAYDLSRPLIALMAQPGTTELAVNEDKRIYLEIDGNWQLATGPLTFLTDAYLHNLSRAVNSWTGGRLSWEDPILTGRLPSGERIQILSEPAVEKGYSITIRKQDRRNISLEQYIEDGFFSQVTEADAFPQNAGKPLRLAPQAIARYIADAVLNKANIIISGGTGTGKTTFMNTLARIIPHDQRIITLEDTREIELEQPNSVHLLAQRERENTKDNPASFDNLLVACLRMKPDRIFAAELRAGEAFTFLNTINTGHPGSLTTLHANSCKGAYRRLEMMLRMSGKIHMNQTAMHEFIGENTDMIIQINRIGDTRRITGIFHRNRFIHTAGNDNQETDQ